MLLQKTSWRIKQFISHRKTNSHENIADVNDERTTDVKLSTNHPKRVSWASQTPSSEATSPLRRASSNATSRSLRLVIPTSNTTTAHSSASSLCSCDCALVPIPPLPANSLSLIKSRLEPRPEILCLPSLTPPTANGDARKWQLIFSDPFAAKSPVSNDSSIDPSTTSTSAEASEGCTLDLLSALDEIDPAEAGEAHHLVEANENDSDKTPTQSIRLFESEMETPTVSENVSQLIRETDEAFQAVGTALADAKAVGNGWYDDGDPPIARNFALSRTNSARRPPVSRTPVISRSPVGSQNQKQTPRTSLGRHFSVTKAKPKTKFIKRKTNIFGKTLRSVSAVPPIPSNTSSRWTLTDVTTNMVDVFSGKIFRTEVEEILTPGRIKEIRQRDAEVLERRISEESSRSGNTDGSTPTEPFHLESLSERLNASKSTPGPPLELEQQLRLKRMPADISLKSRKVKFVDLSISKPDAAAMTIEDLTFPSPPRTPSKPSISSRNGSVPSLPTIPEVSPLAMPSLNAAAAVFAKLQSASLSQDPLTPPASPPRSFISLPSTTHTLTAPYYTHGPIRLNRPPSSPSRKVFSPISPDDISSPLDWTAFQMAISGTSLDDDNAWEDSEAELDDLVAWFESLCLDGYGMLVDVAPAVDVAPHKDRTPRGELFVLPLSPPLHSTPSRKVRNGVVEPIPRGRRGSSAESSGPPSPMIDFGIVGEDRVPMGFNLHHDLGDYLQWEQDHARASWLDD